MSKVDPTTEITPDMLGTFTDATDNPPRAEKKPAAEPDDTPEAEPERKPETKPAAKPAEEPAGDDDPASDEPEEDFEELDISDIDDHIGKAVAKALAESKAEQTTDDEDVDPEVKKLREENAKLKQTLAETDTRLAEKEERDAKAALKHQISSTVGKYKMTAAEIATTVSYMQANADLVVGEHGMKFEEAALRRLPALRDRLKTSPDPPTQPGKAEGVIDAPAGAGAGAPRPWKHTPKSGDYSDITKHELETGAAAAIGRYT